MIRIIKAIKEKRNEEKIDLVKEFHRLNHEVFNDEIKFDFDLIWKKMKGKAGICSYTAMVQGKKVLNAKVSFIALSNFYDYPYETLINTLIHEMIHALLCQRGIINDIGSSKTHGYYFKQEMNRINQHFKQKYYIEPTENSSAPIETSHIANKLIYGLIMNKKHFLVMTRSMNKEEIRYIFEMFLHQAQYTKKDQTLEWFITKHPYFFRFKTYRQIKWRMRLDGYPMKPEDYQNIEVTNTRLLKPDGTIIEVI
jgi:hypothetical protein